MRLSFFYFRRFLIIIAVLGLTTGSLLMAQERARNVTPLSFVFLPLRSSQQLLMADEQFMDEVIKVIRMRGHNAVSTRYLRSVLLDSRFGALEACTTSVCMKKLANMVGTSFVIHGSLYQDSSSDYIAEIHLVDAQNNLLISVLMESFNKNFGVSAGKILDFTDKILREVTDAVSKVKNRANDFRQAASATAISAVQADKAEEPLQSVGADVQEVSQTTDTVQMDKLDMQSDSGGLDQSNELHSEPSQSLQQIAQISVNEDTGAESIPETENVSEISADAQHVNIQTVVENSGDSQTANDTSQSHPDNAIIASVADIQTVENIPIDSVLSETEETTIEKNVDKSVSSQPDPLPPVLQADGPAIPVDALSRNNKNKILKKVRIYGFGVVALSGVIGGIVTNSAVKKSLRDEKALFDVYMKANTEQTGEAYLHYINKTEKTDAKIRQRSLLYVLGGLGLAACGISFKF